MRKLIAILIATAMACAFAPMVGADGTETIVVTLDPQETVDITCNQTEWNPSCALNGTESTATTWGGITNTGDINVKISIEATDSVDWTIETTAGHDQFVLETLGADAQGITTDPEPWITDLPGDDVVSFGLKVTMPTTSSTSVSQETTITFTATVLA
jgi:hypothetical protein